MLKLSSESFENVVPNVLLSKMPFESTVFTVMHFINILDNCILFAVYIVLVFIYTKL